MTIDVPLESPKGSILNYSIISSDEEDNLLILKLKISKPKKLPLVMLHRLENPDEYGVSLKNFREAQNEVSTPRKKGKSRKTDLTDAEEFSPKKIQKIERTPQKVDTLGNLDSLCASITDKVKLTTPVKRSLAEADNDWVISSSKGSCNKVLLQETPTRRSSRRLSQFSLRKANENDAVRLSKRRSCAPIRFRDEFNPQSDKSLQKTILKSQHNAENIMKLSDKNNKKTNSRSEKNKYNSDEGDEAIQVAEALKRSEIEVFSHKRVLRSRSSSNCSVMTTSDADLPSEDISLKKRQVRRTKKVQRIPKNKIHESSREKNMKPKSRLRMLQDDTVTPSMQPRSGSIANDSTPLTKARIQLHVSHIPTSLPCREKEYTDVYNFLKGKLEDGSGGCMYISGVPGTGKTATVTSVIDNLTNDPGIPKFCYVNINGMRLTESRQAYVAIWKQLTGKTVPWQQAQSLLEERFTKKKSGCVVMLIDELDILCTKRQDVVYNLLDWPTKCRNQLVVVTIANTMDLPERLLMNKVTSRLGLTRLTFQVYTHKQLTEIVNKRLAGTGSFNSDAIQLVARKVASVSGDARRALDICRRAAEIAEAEGQSQLVNITHVNEALTAMITQPKVTAVKRCSRLQKLLLQAIVAEIERTGVEETTVADVFRMLVSCCALDGFKMVTCTAAQRALCELGAYKLILTDQKCSNIYQKVALNVSVHDVYFALKND